MPSRTLIEEFDEDCIREVEALKNTRSRTLEECCGSAAINVHDSTARPHSDLGRFFLHVEDLVTILGKARHEMPP
jgi:hypothetical protein